jgi:flagellar hook-associated protein FlgK
MATLSRNQHASWAAGNLNSVIVRGTQSGADVTDALDSRDQVLLALSEEIGIKTITAG